MALICENCGKGVMYGHAVSHAKNRVKRLFRPNVQKLKVLRDGAPIRVKLCTSCIQRLKKDKSLGFLRMIEYINPSKDIKEAILNIPKIEVESAEKKLKEAGKKKAESLKIEDIVGKSN